MLKITVSNSTSGTTFLLSGRLVGPWVEELRQCWLQAKPGRTTPCQVDLRDVTFVDEAGTTLLSEMNREGVTIHASGCLMRAVVQNLGQTGRRACDGGIR